MSKSKRSDDMPSSILQIDVDPPLAWVTMSRSSEGNPIDARTTGAFRAAWVTLAEDERIKAVGICAKGPTFSVGLPASSTTSIEMYGPKSCNFWKPILVELSGDVSSGAFQLLGQADVVIATPGVKLATIPDLAGMTDAHHLGPRLPHPEIARLALLGSTRPMTADRASQLGLFDEIVPFSNLRRRSIERLRLLAGLDLHG
jgi:enoyl-CoA hydratase/carnithine racemase